MDLNIVNNEEKFLSGKLEGYTLKGAENKFDDKGNPLPFSGCTIICNIPLNTNLSDEIISFQKKIENFNPKKTYFYLPCLLYTSPSPRDRQKSRMPSSA